MIDQKYFFPDHGRQDQIDIDETHGQLLDTLAQ